jgi:hypothetical protein
MSKRSSEGEQKEIWVAHRELARAPGHLFYEGNATRQLVLELNMTPVVPPKSNRLDPWE